MKKIIFISSLIVFLLSFIILKKIFVDKKPQPTVSPLVKLTVKKLDDKVKLGFMGDIGLGRYITYSARKERKNFNLFEGKIKDFLLKNDLNLANFESPLISENEAECPSIYDDTFKFCADPRFIANWTENKLSSKFFFNLANNHILNYGEAGLVKTKDYFDDNQISYVYSHFSDYIFPKFQTKKINNIHFGFLGYDLSGGHAVDKNSVLEKVKKYNPQVDWLIVSLHWGNEYELNPALEQIEYAHRLIDAGADIIHGTHPHVFQPLEDNYKENKLIFYSLGNFVFDQFWSKETRNTYVFRVGLTKDKILEIAKFHVYINSSTLPQIVAE